MYKIGILCKYREKNYNCIVKIKQMQINTMEKRELQRKKQGLYINQKKSFSYIILQKWLINLCKIVKIKLVYRQDICNIINMKIILNCL